MRLTGSVVQPRMSNDLLTYKAIGSNCLSFVVTSMLVSTSPLDEAGTATQCTSLPPTWAKSLTKLNPKMQDFKRVLDLNRKQNED